MQIAHDGLLHGIPRVWFALAQMQGQARNFAAGKGPNEAPPMQSQGASMSVNLSRRGFVQAASLLPVGLLAGASLAQDPPRRLPIPPLLDARAARGTIA